MSLAKVPYEIAKGLVENEVPFQSDWDKVKDYLTHSEFSDNEILIDIEILPEKQGGKTISNIYKRAEKED